MEHIALRKKLNISGFEVFAIDSESPRVKIYYCSLTGHQCKIELVSNLRLVIQARKSRLMGSLLLLSDLIEYLTADVAYQHSGVTDLADGGILVNHPGGDSASYSYQQLIDIAEQIQMI